MGGLEEDDPKPWRGFRARVNLHCLGAIMQSIWERKRESTESRHKFKKGKMETTYAWKMHEYVTSEFKSIIGIPQSKPNST